MAYVGRGEGGEGRGGAFCTLPPSVPDMLIT